MKTKEILEESFEKSDNQDSFQSIKFQDLEIESDNLKIQRSLSDSFWPTQMASSIIKSTIKKTCSNFQTIKTNLKYNLKHCYFSKRQKLSLLPGHGVSLLGKNYKSSREKQDFYVSYHQVIWLTYRSGIYGIQSDAGWGCMIRVCQMVLAEVIKNINSQKSTQKIVDLFKDTPQAYFSLTRICQKGKIDQRWTSSIEVFTVLKKLISENNQIKLSIDIHSMFIQIQDLAILNEQIYPKLIFVSNRLGKCKIDDHFRSHLLQLMNIDYFTGFIGGDGGQALYLIGNYDGKLIFLDPHYVQENENQNEHISTYFSGQPYLIDIDQLASSIAFNFLVKSQKQHLQLLEKLMKLQKFYQGGLCLQIFSKQLEKNHSNDEKKDKRKQQSEQQFEAL